MQKSEYKTKQRSRILDCLSANTGIHMTADDITEYLKNSSEPVGKTTVYRALDKLVTEGKVRKYINSNGESACYQYIADIDECNEHFHLKCTACGKLFHVECEYLNELGSHIFEHHRFTVDNTKTVLYGLCEECSSKKKGE